jgi:hypothetical protein
MEQQVEAKINFIEICLGYFVGNPREDVRENDLLGELAALDVNEKLKKQLRGYISMTKEELKAFLLLLQEKLKLSSKLFGISFLPLLLICFLSPPPISTCTESTCG